LLNDPALLSLATLAATLTSKPVLVSVAQRVNQLEESRRQEVLDYAKILTGLKFTRRKRPDSANISGGYDA